LPSRRKSDCLIKTRRQQQNINRRIIAEYQMIETADLAQGHIRCFFIGEKEREMRVVIQALLFQHYVRKVGNWISDD
jgi:hypothetical protein